VDRSNPGATRLNRLEEKIEAAAIELTSDDLREIESAAALFAATILPTISVYSYGFLNRPACSCVSITLPASRKRA
jgi:hypothetical protein